MESEGRRLYSATERKGEINWKRAKIITERRLRLRIVKEGIASHQQKHHGSRVLNVFEQVDSWKPLLNQFFYSEKSKNLEQKFVWSKVYFV